MRGMKSGQGSLGKWLNLRSLGLGLIPIGATIAFLNNASLVMFALAAATPLILAFSSVPDRSQTPSLDAETGFHDEETLVATLDSALETADFSRKVACLVVELDAFEDLEKTWDRATLSAAIPQVADRISALLRTEDIVARISRNGFAIALPDVRTPELGAIISLTERLQKSIAEPMNADGASLHLTASVGFCLRNQIAGNTGADLLAAAKIAMSDARRFAPQAARSYPPEPAKPFMGSEILIEEVSVALRDGDIVPWFQPQVSTDTGQVTGFEALARWAHPERGTVSPANFLPALEASGQMELLSEAILVKSLQALKTWDKSGFEVPSVSVNFATQELRNPSLVERIKWDVDRFSVTPERLTIEILETVISGSDDDIISRNIRALRNQGFRIDLDDFGTGHASLANIRRFSVDRIKIDRSFVTRADEDPEQQRMIAAIVGMSEQLRIDTLAEGVETVGEYTMLSQLGCTHLQGFAIAKPMPLDETLHWMDQHYAKLKAMPSVRRGSA
ncbi:MAG: GGDEF domain-containing protein [Litoreibacter sp.]|nr:GGDEF domain-containing protein [Litoreibacter sp.]